MAQEKMSALAQVEARRAERKAKAQRDHEARLAVDLAAIDEIEAAYGDASIAVIRMAPGDVPAAVAVRTPKPPEMKRWRDRVKPTKDSRNREVTPDASAAAEELGSTCRIYPAQDAEGEALFEALLQSRPGILVQMGTRALELGGGREESEGKG